MMYNCVPTNDYKQIKKKCNIFFLILMEHWKYSYDNNQTFTNESSFDIK